MTERGKMVMILVCPDHWKFRRHIWTMWSELNSMYFNQNYTAVDSKYGSMVTILAPVSDQILEV